MPVSFDSSTSNNLVELAASVTSGSVTAQHAVNPLATNVVGTAAFYVSGNVDLTAATLAVTWDGVAMTQSGPTVFFNSNKDALALFTLANPAAGKQNVVGSVSGLTANANSPWLMLDTESCPGVGFIGTPVTVSGATVGAQTANSVTVSSVDPAHRVITVHAVRTPNLFSAYNLATRSITDGSYNYTYTQYFLGIFPIGIGVASAAGGELLMGDAPGAATVTGTATQPSTALWGAIGLPLAPCPVVIGAGLGVSADVAASLAVHRVTTPSPRRTWVIGASQ